jgi:anti-anti-sigma factor
MGIQSAPAVRSQVADRGMQDFSIIAAQQVIQRTLPALERRLDEILAGKPAVVDVVLSAVQIVDSAGLNWLLSIQGRLETLGVRMRLVDPSPIMADVLLSTRLDARFTVEVTGGAGAGNGHGPGVNHG